MWCTGQKMRDVEVDGSEVYMLAANRKAFNLGVRSRDMKRLQPPHKRTSLLATPSAPLRLYRTAKHSHTSLGAFELQIRAFR